MIKGQEVFNFIDKRHGVTKDGEKYIALNVLSKDNMKFSFISKDEKIINTLAPLNLQRFAEIKLFLGFERVFNSEKRTSYWDCILLGVD